MTETPDATIARLTAELEAARAEITRLCDRVVEVAAERTAAEALLARAYEAGVEGEGPQVAGYTCRGCRHFHSEYWREPDGEGGMDSGTSATCLLLGKNISSYCGSNPPPPDWCPKPRAIRALPTPSPADLAARLTK